MPKAKPFLEGVQALRNHIPRGMFSTLDELIDAHPSGKATAQEWSNYLKPGQTLTREGVSFPLKQEELDYTGLSTFFKNLDERNRDVMIEGPNLQNMARRQRPYFYTGQRPNGGERYRQYSHADSPGSSGDYQEDLTRAPGLGEYDTHFTPDTLSWSRTTGHNLPGVDPYSRDSGALRLIEEIQSDRHAAAAEKVIRNDRGQLLDQDESTHLPAERRGYRTPEDEARLAEMRNQTLDLDEAPDRAHFAERNQLLMKPPDAPFKSAADYGSLEMRKQLLNAVNADQDYLGLVRGKDQIARYPGLNPEQQKGMEYGYDKVYKGALEKLGRQYGAPMTEIGTQIPVSNAPGKAPATFDHFGAVDLPDFLNTASDTEDTSDYALAIRNLLNEYSTLPQQSDDFKYHLGRARDRLDGLEAVEHNGDDADLFAELQGHVENHLHNLDQEWNKYHQSLGPEPQENKTFPAIQLTPEVKEKVKKAGVPIWQLGGALAGGDVVKQALESQEDRPDPTQGFAEGGEVDSSDDSQSTLAQLRAYMDRVPGEDSESDAQYAAPIASFFKGNAIDDTLSMGAHTLGAMARPWNGSDMNSAYAQSLKNVADYFTGVGDRASDRADERTKKVRHELGVGEPKTLMNKLAAAAGETTTMLPLPESAITRLGKVGHLSEMAGLTIDPKHYPLWTGINGAIGELPESLDWLASKLKDEPPPRVAAQDDSDAPTVDFMKEQGYFKGGEARMNKQCGGLTYATGGVVPPRAINDSGLIASQTSGVPVGSSAGLTPAAASTTGVIGGRGIANPAMFPNSGRIIIPQPQNTGMTVGGTPAYQPIPIPGHGSTPGSVPAGSLGGNGPNGPNLLTNGTSSDGSGGDPYAQARARLARLFHSPYRNPNGYAGGGPVDGGTLQTVKHVYHRVHSGEQELSEGISDLMSQLDIDADQARAALNALHQSGYQPTAPSAQTEEMPTTG